MKRCGRGAGRGRATRALAALLPAVVAAAVVVGMVGVGGGRAARAHDMRPALLSLTQVARDDYDVDLRVPIEIALLDAPVPVFPPGSEQLGGTSRTRAFGNESQRFRVRVPGGLAGRRLGVSFAHGATARPSEILVRIAHLDGRTTTGRMVAVAGESAAGWVVPADLRAVVVAQTYLHLGVTHILGGFDHLAFVLALVLLAPAWRRLWRTVTAFTAAHSLTLALAALGIVRLPPAPIEAAIALSIALVAREVWLAQRGVRPARAAWPMAFGFGLLHGLGFAGALSEIGLPPTDIPLALLMFNVGVEIGQLAFVAAVLLTGRALSRLPATRDARVRQIPTYVVGILAAFWCFQRIASF
jgi:hydrogenase/urease accessory protein HupE